MPSWKNVIKAIAESIEEASRDTHTGHRRKPRPGAAHGTGTQSCLFWECGTPVRSGHTYCYRHYQEYQDGEVDVCPGCKQGKYSKYDLCLHCQYDPEPSRPRTASRIRERYEPENSAAWEEGDADATEFYVYVLKLEGGAFYAGQTRELRERLTEHRDGTVASTADKNPRLVWFTIVPSREDATELEVELKKLVDSNPREVRRLVVGFQDLVRELDFG